MGAHGGIDFERMGMAWGLRDAIQIQGQAVIRWQEHAARLERRLALARAEIDAADAGRLAQIHALQRALEAVAPLDPVLRRTGRLHGSGNPELAFEAGYADAYDDAARGTGLDRCERPMTPGERADAAEAEVLAQPITVRGWGWWERILWQGEQHRTVAGAERARAAAARAAREAVS